MFVLPEKIVKKRVCVTLTKPYLDALDRLVQQGVYVDRAELIKDALRRLFRHYGMEPFVGEGFEAERGSPKEDHQGKFAQINDRK